MPFATDAFAQSHNFFAFQRKPIPIQGTNLTLDTPEALDAWIEERRKKFPTKEKVAEKEKKLQDAIDRGEILPADVLINARKRQRRDQLDGNAGESRGRGRGCGRGQRGSRGRGRGGHGEFAHNNPPRTTPIPLPAKPITAVAPSESSSSDESSDSDMNPEVDAVSSKVPGTVMTNESEELHEANDFPLDPESKMVCPILPRSCEI